MRGIASVLGMLILLLLPAIAATAVEGRIVYLTGEVTVTSGGTTTSADIGTPVEPGDVVETGATATAIIDLGHGAEIKLRENTRTRIGPLEERVDVELERGGLFALIRRVIQGRLLGEHRYSRRGRAGHAVLRGLRADGRESARRVALRKRG